MDPLFVPVMVIQESFDAATHGHVSELTVKEPVAGSGVNVALVGVSEISHPLIFVTNASWAPAIETCAGTTLGKSVDVVLPVRYRFALVSMAILPAASSEAPPRYVDHSRAVPGALILVINRS